MKLLIVIFVCIYSTAGDLDTKWWKRTTMYEMIVNVFKDSNGDGIGDIKGIILKLDHFVDLGIDTLYLTPCFDSPMKDMGYEITDYYKIYPKYGTMEDFEELIKEMNARGMKLMFDLVINHSGDTHEWFQKSIKRIDPYTDYYIWANRSDNNYDENSHPKPPNKWESMFGGSAWQWNSERKQFYYHMFLKEQPDLNLRNEHVKTELKNMIKFWMDKGVAGFRLDAPMFYMEPLDLNVKSIDSHKENIAFIHEMRLFLDEYNKNHGGLERIFAAEARLHQNNQLMDYYGRKKYPVTHFPFHYLDGLADDQETTATYFYDHFIDWFDEFRLDLNYTPVWVTEGHDGHRIGNRLSPQFSDILTIMTMALPGSVCLYYGQEIAMRNGYIRPEQIRDISGQGTRDPARLIMQWDDSLNAGFSSNMVTYLPVSPEFTVINVKEQKKQKKSHYNIIKTLSSLRKRKTLIDGDIHFLVIRPQTFVFWRTYKGYESYFYVANLDHSPTYINLKNLMWDSPDTFVVAVASVNSEHTIGDKIPNDFNHQIPLRPLSCVLLTLSENNEFDTMRGE